MEEVCLDQRQRIKELVIPFASQIIFEWAYGRDGSAITVISTVIPLWG
jgi:hypothetical protein